MAQTVWLPGGPLVIPGVYGPRPLPEKDKVPNKEFYKRQVLAGRWTFYYDKEDMDEELYSPPNMTLFAEIRGGFNYAKMAICSGWV